MWRGVWSSCRQRERILIRRTEQKAEEVELECWQPHPSSGVHDGSVSQQTPDHLHLTCPGCHVQSCFTSLEATTHVLMRERYKLQLAKLSGLVVAYYVADVRRGSVLQQQQDDVQVTHEGCHVDRSQTRLDTGSEE